MKKINQIIIYILLATNACAQEFKIRDQQLWDFAIADNEQSFPIYIQGLPESIDSNFGIETAGITIHHKRVSDIKITLVSPNGSQVWLSNRNGRDKGSNYINTVFANDKTRKYIHQAVAPFTGTFQPDGRLEYFNNGQNPNGIWKLMIEDLKPGFEGYLDSFFISFSNNPAKLAVAKTCAPDKPQNCKCIKGNNMLMPDLVILSSFTKAQIKEYAWNDSLYPGQLRFAATIANIGIGPLEIFGSNQWYCGDNIVDSSLACGDGQFSRQIIMQRVYKKVNDRIEYADNKAGTLYFDNKPGHNHYHVDSWVDFRLIKMVKNKKKSVAHGKKISYCLFNTGMCTNSDRLCNIGNIAYGENMMNYGFGIYGDCKDKVQGIGVGGYDTYGMMYEGQSIELPKGLRNGEYILEIEIDPEHKYIESNKSNNTFQMKVNIQKQ